MSWLNPSSGAPRTYGSKKLTRPASTSSVTAFATAFAPFSARFSDENSGFSQPQAGSQRSPLRPADPNTRDEAGAETDEFGNAVPVTGKRQRGEQAGTRAKQRASLTSPINFALSELSLASPVHCGSPTFSEGSATEKRTLRRTSRQV